MDSQGFPTVPTSSPEGISPSLLHTTGDLMPDMSFRLTGDEAVTIDDMGECIVVFTQEDEAGLLHRVVVNLEDHLAALAPVMAHYGFPKTQIAA